MPARKNLESFKEEIENHFGYEPYEFLGDYVNSVTPIKVICKTCKTEIKIIPKQFNRIIASKRKKHICPICNRPDKTLDDYINELIKRDGSSPYKFLEEYVNAATPIKAICLRCNNEIKVIPGKINDAIRKGIDAPCPHCAVLKTASINRNDTDSYLQQLDSLFTEGEGYNVLEPYKGISHKILHQCRICNYTWKISPTNIISYRHTHRRACPSCNNMVRDTRPYEERLKDISNGNIINLEPYKNRRKKIKHKCLVCNHEWLVAPGNIIGGNRCPNCSIVGPAVSSHEDKLYAFLKDDLKIKNIVRNSRKVLGNGKELDIFLPDYNIAIEVNGLYWHSEKYKDKKYHLDKLNTCNQLGIKLLQFYDDTIMNKEDIVKDKIRHELGKSKYKIYARKCLVKEVNTEIKSKFLNKNHLQGAVGSNYNIGLYYKDDLVALMTFGKPRISMGNKNSSNNDVELIRYATKLNHSIVGGFSKLLSFMKKSSYGKKFTRIITYADKNISTGNLYTKNGFSFSHCSKPSYFYVNRNNYKRFNRFNFRKSNLKEIFPELYKESLTEFQIMDSTKEYYRVWNSGNNVYYLNLN